MLEVILNEFLEHTEEVALLLNSVGTNVLFSLQITYRKEVTSTVLMVIKSRHSCYSVLGLRLSLLATMSFLQIEQIIPLPETAGVS